MAQRWPAAKPKLPQAEFDEAVKTNIEDFDMESEEAVKSAIEEFELQGYDLSGVFKSADGTNIEEQPLAVASRALDAALPAEEGTSSFELDSVSTSLDTLFQALNADESKAQEILAVALKVNSLKPVLRAVELLSVELASSSAALPPLIAALGLAKQLMDGSPEIRDRFDDLNGHSLSMRLLERHQDLVAVLSAVAALGAAAELKDEANKEKLTEAGFGESMIAILRTTTEKEAGPPNAELISNACAALTGLVTADDDRPGVCSCAFKNARALAGKHDALKVLLVVLRQVCDVSTTLCTTVLSTVKALAANEEICKAFADDGGIATMLDIIRRWTSSTEVVRADMQALRQLSIADPVKKLLAANGGIEVILELLSVHPEAEDVLEPTLGVFANMTLRLPEIVTQAVEAGAIDVIISIMAAQPNMGPVQRQFCIIVRNMVVRTTENREAFLSQDVEEMIRDAKKRFPNSCKDVGYAALRDLGLDNYND